MDARPVFVESADGGKKSSYKSVSLRRSNAFASCYHHDFISLLAIAQQLQIDFMPISWQEAMGALGEGGTSLVQQSNAIKATLSFAFKRTLPFSNRQYDDAYIDHHAARLGALISEILVLGHPAVRNHPNFVQIEGIAWDLEGDVVWPVIVSERAQFGNLSEFPFLEAAKALSFTNKISMCLDIASAVGTMHYNNIIHGDIKPQNIFIFPGNGENSYVARVADFGYSCIGSREDDFVRLPLSQPWEAPEYHDRDITICNAKRLDVYSFGLTCFWILWDHTAAGGIQLEDKIAELKDDKLLLSFINDFIGTRETVPQLSKIRMNEFFAATLCEEAEDRRIEWNYLTELLGDGDSKCEDIGDVLAETLVGLHPDFRILKDILALDQADHRIRLYIERCMIETAMNKTCDDCSLNKPFIAPGSSEEVEDFEEPPQLLDFLENGQKVGDAPRIINEHLMLYDFDLVDSYVSQSCLLEAENYYRRELSSRSAVMNSDHILVRGSCTKLSSILAFQSKHQEAKDLILDGVKILREKEPSQRNHVRVWLTMGGLAWIEYLQGHFRDAEMAQLEAVEAMDKYMGSIEHPVLLKSRTNLSAILSKQGKWSEAVELDQAILSSSRQNLGDEHPDTMSCMANLATVLAQQGSWRQARDIKQQVLDLRIRLLGKKSLYTYEIMREVALLDTYLGNFDQAFEAFDVIEPGQRAILGENGVQYLDTLENKSHTHLECGQLDQALNLQMKVNPILKSILGEFHPRVLRSAANLACTKRALGDHDGALRLLEFVGAQREAALGCLHPDTLTSQGLLADTLRLSQKVGEARIVGTAVVNGLTKLCGENHPDTITAKVGLAQTMLQQGEFDNAVSTLEKCMEWSAKTLGKDHTTTLRYKSTLANALSDIGQYGLSELLLKEVIDAQEKVFNPNKPSLIVNWANMAVCKMHRQDFDSAEEILQRIGGSALRILGPHHPHTLTVQANLAAVAGEKGDLDLAIKCSRGVIRLRESSLSGGGRSTLTDRGNLAVLLNRNGHFEEAEVLAIKVLEDSVALMGSTHAGTIRAWNNLAVIYTRQDRWDEARDALTVTVDIATKTLGQNHPVTQKFDANLQAVIKQLEIQEAGKKRVDETS